MIYILTLHYQNTEWLDIQTRYLNKFSDSSKYRVILGLYNLSPIYNELSHYTIVPLDKVENNHKSCMEYLYQYIRPVLNIDDIIIFMDGDAFPICDWIPKLQSYFVDNDMVSVYRKEDSVGRAADDIYSKAVPHLCFTACKKGVWSSHNLGWDLGLYECPGYLMQDIININKIKVKELYRTNKYNAHNVMFGVYDDMIYHHGNGSTAATGVNTTRQCYEGQDLINRYELWKGNYNDWDSKCSDISSLNYQISKVIFDTIKADKECKIIRRYFIGKP